jgi:hypothetical protein
MGFPSMKDGSDEHDGGLLEPLAMAPGIRAWKFDPSCLD